MFGKYVYTITNIKNGKVYVGASQNPEYRFKSHIWLLRSGKHSSKTLQTDYDLFGEECFRMSVVSKKMNDRLASIEERGTMVKLKTYDSKYGYNDSDNAMNAVRRMAGLSFRESKLKGAKRMPDGTFLMRATS